MKKLFMLLLALLFVVGVLFMPATSSAVPANGNAGGNGNSTLSGTDGPVSVPGPVALFFLGYGLIGLIWVKRKLEK